MHKGNTYMEEYILVCHYADGCYFSLRRTSALDIQEEVNKARKESASHGGIDRMSCDYYVDGRYIRCTHYKGAKA